MNEEICGFLVVRKPEENFDSDKETIDYFRNPPKLNNFTYSGIDRMLWLDLDQAENEHESEAGIADINKEINKDICALSNFGVVKEFKIAKQALDYSNKINHGNEICVVYSQELKKIKPSFITDIRVKWLGVDLYSPSYGSLLRIGIFDFPDRFNEHIDNLNNNGLFEINDSKIDDYFDLFLEYSKKTIVEPLYDERQSIFKINIGRVFF